MRSPRGLSNPLANGVLASNRANYASPRAGRDSMAKCTILHFHCRRLLRAELRLPGASWSEWGRTGCGSSTQGGNLAGVVRREPRKRDLGRETLKGIKRGKDRRASGSRTVRTLPCHRLTTYNRSGIRRFLGQHTISHPIPSYIRQELLHSKLERLPVTQEAADSSPVAPANSPSRSRI
jgi:hypothetical protein